MKCTTEVDLIRTMSDEQLASFIFQTAATAYCAGRDDRPLAPFPTIEATLDFLRQWASPRNEQKI